MKRINTLGGMTKGLGLMGGGGGFSPTQIPGLLLWLDADDLAGNDGDAIAAWTSKEGNAYVFGQTDNTKKPLLKKAANGIGGRNTVLFDGSNDLLYREGDIVPTGETGTVIAVYKLSASPKAQQVAFASNCSTDAEVVLAFSALNNYPTNSNIEVVQRNNDTLSLIRGTTAVQADTPYIAIYQSNGSAYSMSLNGNPEVVAIRAGANNGDWFSDTNSVARDRFTIGGEKGTTETSFLKGSLAALLVYNSNLGSADLSRLGKWLGAKYGINF